MYAIICAYAQHLHWHARKVTEFYLFFHFYTHKIISDILRNNYFILSSNWIIFLKNITLFFALIFCFLQFESPVVIHEVKVNHHFSERDQKLLDPYSLKSTYSSKIFELSLQTWVYNVNFSLYKLECKLRYSLILKLNDLHKVIESYASNSWTSSEDMQPPTWVIIQTLHFLSIHPFHFRWSFTQVKLFTTLVAGLDSTNFLLFLPLLKYSSWTCSYMFSGIAVSISVA